MKQRIRIDFCDFGVNFSKTTQFLFLALSERFKLHLSDQPDFLIYDVAGHAHRLHSCVRIRFTCESSPPDYSECDYSIGPLFVDDPRHLYLPAYVVFGGPAEALIKASDKPEEILTRKNKFCSFVVSGHHPRKNRGRLDIFNALSRYKRVDSAGRFMNNIGGPLPGGPPGKVAFLQPYKFNIAYENASHPGYLTEKLYHAMLARCVPIFWGDSCVRQQFNPASFLNRSDFPTDEALLEKVVELDSDNEKYLALMREPYLPNDQPTLYFNHERILNFFERVFTTPIQPVGRRRKWFHFGRWRLVKQYHRHPLPEGWSQQRPAASSAPERPAPDQVQTSG